MRFPFVAALVLVAGCADYNLANDLDTAGSADSPGFDSNRDSDDEAPAEPAQYWSLDGTLVVAGGALDVDASALYVDLWLDGHSVCGALPPSDTGSADTDTATDADVAVPTEPDVAFASVQEAPSDVALLAWWDLALTEGAVPCEQPLPASAVGLGLGPMDPRLYPALENAGFGDPAAAGATLYSAYLRVGSGDVWVFGVAGTTEQFAGTGAVVDTAPLPDGTYELRSLYLLPTP